eukprot:scaffold107872_cov51-Attheya_sp.AAC.3
MVRVPFRETFVEYEKEDVWGPLWALASLVPPLGVASLCSVLVVTRDLRIAFGLGGVLVTCLVCVGLKRVYPEPRPPPPYYYDHDDDTSDEDGWPSNHSAFGAFCATFIFLFTLRRCPAIPRLEKWVPCSVVCLITGVACPYSRIHLGYHTISQVMAGMGLGTTMGVLWFLIGYERLYIPILAPFLLHHLPPSLHITSPHNIPNVALARQTSFQQQQQQESYDPSQPNGRLKNQ